MLQLIKEKMGLTKLLPENEFNKGIVLHNCYSNHRSFLKVVDFYLKTDFKGVILNPESVLESGFLEAYKDKKSIIKVSACDSLEQCMDEIINENDVVIVTDTNQLFTEVFYKTVTFSHNANMRDFKENGDKVIADKKNCRFFLSYNAMKDIVQSEGSYDHDNICVKLRNLRATGTSIIFFEDMTFSQLENKKDERLKPILEYVGLVANYAVRDFDIRKGKLVLPYGYHNLTHQF